MPFSCPKPVVKLIWRRAWLAFLLLREWAQDDAQVEAWLFSQFIARAPSAIFKESAIDWSCPCGQITCTVPDSRPRAKEGQGPAASNMPSLAPKRSKLVWRVKLG